jgi:acylpyruvate hydrolase
VQLVNRLVIGESRVSVVVGDRVADINGVTRVLAGSGTSGDAATSLAAHRAPPVWSEFLALGADGIARVRQVIDYVAGASEAERKELVDAGWLIALDRAEFSPPMSPTNTLYCIGQNYADHVREIGGPLPEFPGVFIRTPASVVGHRQPVVRPVQVSTQLDFEGELAVVIGAPCHRVAASQALDYVLGYTICDEGSVRDYQKRVDAFLTSGKIFHHSGSLGPWVVTADEIPDPQALDLMTTVNDDVLQSANTSDMIFDVRTLVAYISDLVVLQPGDLIATGTPAGIGFRRTPKRFLNPGDRLAITIEGIGVLENTIVDEAPMSDRTRPLIRA